MDIACIILLFIAGISGKALNSSIDSRLSGLRDKIRENNLYAYIIPSSGDHQEEFPAKPDCRREYISGFTGSFGDAVVTLDEAMLWTDSRYFIQAERQLGPSWSYMKSGSSGVPTVEEWLKKKLNNGRKVGVDPKKITFDKWNNIESQLNASLVALDNNLVDEIWDERPKYSTKPIYVHDIMFSGESHVDKLGRLRESMKSAGTDLFVAFILDEIAWLLNLRGDDIPMTPVFMSYMLISAKFAKLYIHEEKNSSELVAHLSHPNASVEVLPYSLFYRDLSLYAKRAANVFLHKGTSYAIHQKVLNSKIYITVSPLMLMKSVKNDVEVKGSRYAHLRDSVALCELFKTMEEQVKEGIYWDELKVSDTLVELRSKQKWNKGSSFPTIAAFGKNGALPHYIPTKETNLQISTCGLLTIDSGGQYLDGTIDTTRVLHFGEPTETEKSIYTYLLQGVADLASTIFPDGTKAEKLEMIVRRPLLRHGLTFAHGTTHGTGIFLSVHEGINADNPKKLLKFSQLTLVPYELKLVDADKMDKSQIKWLNEYHETVRDLVGAEMINQGKVDLQKWLIKKTMPI